MKILFSLTYYSPYISGLTLCVSRIAEGPAKDHEVCVLCMRHDSSLSLEERIGEIRKIRVIRANPILKISKGFLSVDWVIKSWIEVRKSDTVVVNLPQPEGIFPAFFAKLFGKKLITIYHCDLKLPVGILNAVAEALVTTSSWLTLQLSDKVITYTEDFAKNSRVLSRFLRKGIFIYPPIIIPNINKRIQKSIRDKIGAGGQFVVGIAARLAAEKGIEYVLEALGELNNEKEKGRKSERERFKLIIAGPMNPVGEEEYKTKILRLVEKYKDQVIFLGSIKPEEMGSFYSLLDVLVLPSVNSTEAFGMVQVEAMMYGVPVVATDLPGVRVPVGKTGMGEIVPVKNAQAIAQSIEKILSDKKKYIKDQEKIEEEFSYNKSIKSYENILTSF
ncbi:hypothetical protein A3D77_00360 [Candidatus Gottesmanbacteria bacterium RIFCSPHIGHO2_02_FULL_39_11]|uniref:Glycosyl transferase family 1 domain-containing protein n=1 Tax=Candidatus Gottesmanbacteria bacterium RIFCSPHIGHO2_02_FULL_39_11 TaxID=1798382 RepID=A0A1F5ZLF4_9BACT|nr:MAG: hypothetical protein A3D77_00360 [Candidatus Gottesmanbacteria bacterium RIFCSPHIGHO2_02_FULL_39_11]